MRYLYVPTFSVAVLVATSTAWGQLGLYGSPEMLQLPHTGTQMGPQPGPATAVYRPATPGYSRPMVRTAGTAPAGTPEAPPPPNPAGTRRSVVNQMLQAPATPGTCAVPQAGCGLFDRAVGEPCAADCIPCTPRCCPWFASIKGLAMTRNNANKVWTSYDPDDLADQMTNTNDIGMAWRGGFEVRFGRRFCCGQWGLEGVYWTLEPFSGFHSTLPPGASGVSTPLRVSEIEFAGVNGIVYFDNAEEHRLWRRDEIHNIEINLLHNRLAQDPAGWFDCQWLLGVRFFRFDESLRFGSLEGEVTPPWTWGSDGGIHEAYLSDQITNCLIGAQIGVDVGWNFAERLRLCASPRIGIYNNQIHNYFQAYRGDGTVAEPTALSGMVGIAQFPVNSITNCVSFLGQIDVGVEWQFARNWSTTIGYRVVAITGVGLADHQIPFYIVDTPEIADIDTNGDLVLHGAFVGIEYNF